MSGVGLPELIVRRAEASDAPALAALDKLCFAMPWSEESLLYEVTGNEKALYVVAETAGEVVGYAGIWLIADEGHITNVAVHPDFRRRHIGEALMTVLLREAAAAGARAQTLEVRVSNTAAQLLYQKFGFEAVGVRPDYYDNNHEGAVIMWRLNGV